MAKRSNKGRVGQSQLKNMVPVAYVDDIDLAKDYQILLRASEIPAEISEKPHDDIPTGERIVVLVPEESIDEARVIIESQDAYEDFYDSSEETEEYQDADEDLFGYEN